MAQITVWGDFKVNKTDNLNLSGGLQLLLNQSEINILNFEAPVRSNAKAIRKVGLILAKVQMELNGWRIAVII